MIVLAASAVRCTARWPKFSCRSGVVERPARLDAVAGVVRCRSRPWRSRARAGRPRMRTGSGPGSGRCRRIRRPRPSGNGRSSRRPRGSSSSKLISVSITPVTRQWAGTPLAAGTASAAPMRMSINSRPARSAHAEGTAAGAWAAAPPDAATNANTAATATAVKHLWNNRMSHPPRNRSGAPYTGHRRSTSRGAASRARGYPRGNRGGESDRYNPPIRCPP